MSELCPARAVPLQVLNEPQAETAAEAFLSLLKDKRLCDVTFVFENSHQKIEAHQFCLRARSPVFESLFGGLGSVTSMTEVKIEHANPYVFNKFLQFICADKFDVAPHGALHLLQLGHKYNVQPLVKKCEDLISEGITTENATEIYETAEKYQLIDMRDQAGDVIARSLEEFLQGGKLMKAKDTTLIALLKRTDLTVKETDLLHLAIQWGKENSFGDPKRAVALTRTLLPFIRFTNMTPQEFTVIVWPTDLLPPDDVIKIYAYMNGDDSIRDAISPSLKYETSSRNMEGEIKFAEIVRFFPEKIDRSWSQWSRMREAEGSEPYKECISFSATVSGPRHHGKAFKIQSVFIKWPYRTVYGWSCTNYQLPIEFKVRVMARGPSCHQFYTTEFETVINNRLEACNGTWDIAIEPPVEICNDFDYRIVVEDEHPCKVGRQCRYVYGPSESTEYEYNRGGFIENKNVKLHIRDIERNNCPLVFPTSDSYKLVHIVRNIRIIAMD